MMLTPERLATARKINSWRKQLTYEAVDLLLDHIDAQQARIDELTLKSESLQQSLHLLMDKAVDMEQDAARYREVRRGQHWSVIDGIGSDLRADELDDAIDAAMQKDKTT